MKTIKLRLSPDGVKEAIKELEEYKKWLTEKTQEFVKELANEGVQVMSVKFAHATYDGTNDVTCKMEERGENIVAVMAVGNATLFIEFGTGVRYPDNHPEAHQNGMIRGEYGKGQGKNPKGWVYVGDFTGLNGQIVGYVDKYGQFVIRTYGNPANMCMWKTIRELQERFEEIGRRVFK